MSLHQPWPGHLCGHLGDSNENKPLVGADEEEVAKMGCPSLGEHNQVEVIIEESYEFKVSVCVPAHSTLTFILKEVYFKSSAESGHV